jgi:CSLREA domain-containing protein
VAVGGLVACEPPVVVLDLTVTTAVDGNDAAPGDGVCEKTVGVGDCTLRAAITEANATAGYDVITIAAGVDPVLAVAGTGDEANANGDLDVAGDVRIVGNGATVDAAGLDRVFDVVSGRVRIEATTLTRGVGAGAAVRSAGHVDLVRTTVTGNSPGSESVIDVSGRAVVTDSAVEGNPTTSNLGAAVRVSSSGELGIHRSLVVAPSGRGLLAASSSRMVVVDSTVQTGMHTAVRSEGFSEVLVARSTLERTGPDGINVAAVTFQSQLVIVGSILAHDAAAPGAALCSGTVTSGGWNVSSHVCDALVATGDVQSVPVLLHPLADDGGATRSMLPYPGSPVLDRIPPGTPFLCEAGSTDQRGTVRPVGAGCDSGAVEGSAGSIRALDPVVDTEGDQPDAAPGDGVCATAGGGCTLRAAAQEINALNPGLSTVEHTITIATGVHPTLSVPGTNEDLGATGDVDVRVPVVIEGGGAVLDGAGLDRVLDFHGPVAVLRGLTITGGYASGSARDGEGGGVRAIDATDLEVEDVAFHANTAATGGGGLSGLRLSVTNSAFTDNAGGLSGGGLLSDASTAAAPVTVTGSTFTGNTAGSGGGLYLNHGTIDRSLIAANEATDHGGGIAGSLGVVTVVSSTVSGNSAAISGAAIWSPGLFGVGTVLVASTIEGNTGAASILTYTTACPRGCLSWETTAMRGTVVVGGGGAAACSAPVTASSFNLVPDGSCGATVPGDSLLGSLADNGGATATHLPAAGSGAIDAVPVGTAGLCDGSVSTDQRGVARPVGPACDVGAVEQ